MKIEEERRRQPGEKVDLFHPQYAEYQAEVRQNEFATKKGEVESAIGGLEDPNLRTIFSGIVELIANVSLGLERVEAHVSTESEKFTKGIMNDMNNRIAETEKWVEESGKSDVIFR